MTRIELTNDNEEILGVWVEPWGMDYWMKRGDMFVIVSRNPEAHLDEQPFEVVFHKQGVSVIVNCGALPDIAVQDKSGAELECGHQRPEGIWE